MTNLVVEGDSDVEAAKAVARAAGHDVAKVIAVRGTGQLDQRIAKYNAAARHATWIVFRDSDSVCPVELRNRLLKSVEENPRFSLRIAHSMIEAWLMADRQGFADYFQLSVDKVPLEPESLTHAKRSLLTLCDQSRSRALRGEMVTERNEIGPLYVMHLNTFASTTWDVEKAADNSDSLRRALAALRRLPH